MEDLLQRCTFLIGRQRSGTTVLRKAIATHPQVRDLGEIMHPGNQNGFYNYLKNELNRDLSRGVHNQWFRILLKTLHKIVENDPSTYRYIVDIKYNMAQAFGLSFRGGAPKNFLIGELSSRNARAIQLIRKNKLQLLTSERVAMKTNQWEVSRTSSEKKAAEVFISPVTLGLLLQQEAEQDRYFFEQTQEMEKKITIFYEDIFSEDGTFNPKIIDNIADIMGISSEFDLEPRILKQRRRMSETITNFEQVKRAVNTLVKEGQIPAFYADTLD